MDPPRHFEMVVQAALDDNRVLGVKPLAVRSAADHSGAVRT